MASVTVTFHLVQSEPRTGLWCDRCALPSRAEVDVTAISYYGVAETRTVGVCTEADHDRRRR